MQWCRQQGECPHARAAEVKAGDEFGVAKFLLGLVERQFELNWNLTSGSLCWLPKFAVVNKLYNPKSISVDKVGLLLSFTS